MEEFENIPFKVCIQSYSYRYHLIDILKLHSDASRELFPNTSGHCRCSVTV